MEAEARVTDYGVHKPTRPISNVFTRNPCRKSWRLLMRHRGFSTASSLSVLLSGLRNKHYIEDYDLPYCRDATHHASQAEQTKETSLSTFVEAQRRHRHRSVVLEDFGEIFSTLLPGAEAKLVPADGDSALNGIEFRIGFNGNWKESLGELSGGQKSLVALSLILAMLRFKPAPIYILDEVDAALDLSHTQNIGAMIKKHFKNAQFIVVSLKEGMFNNANVLFKTRFVDGASTVTRHAAHPVH